VINFGLGWLLYDEPMPPDRLVGFAFVWCALLVVLWDRFSNRSAGADVLPAATASAAG
jgi:chloramphenicol-sensitive protein RarD